MMRRAMFVFALAAAACLLSAGTTWACHKGCGSCCSSGCYTPCCPDSCAPGCDDRGGHAYAGSYYGTIAMRQARTTATVVVTLPADAKLIVDDQPTASTSETRVFSSVNLRPGKVYEYTLRAEVVRDGELQSVSRQITVRAGETTRVNLDIPVATTAAK